MPNHPGRRLLLRLLIALPLLGVHAQETTVTSALKPTGEGAITSEAHFHFHRNSHESADPQPAR